MIYNNRQELIQLLQRENLYTEKHFSQNFLYNTKVIDQIIAAANLAPTDTVVEVGPGLGILTMELVQKAHQVITIERDDKLIPYLQRTFKTYSNLRIIHQDVLESTPPEAQYKVVANIPYHITSPIISHFLQNQQGTRPSLLVLLTQLEVAQKICAKPGDHNVLSLQTQLFCNPTLINRVSANNFLPAPKVDSAILKLETLPQPRITNIKQFLAIIHKAFSQKRKTLANSLNGLYGLGKNEWAERLNQSKLSPNIRPQQLSMADWQNLINHLS